MLWYAVIWSKLLGYLQGLEVSYLVICSDLRWSSVMICGDLRYSGRPLHSLCNLRNGTLDCLTFRYVKYTDCAMENYLVIYATQTRNSEDFIAVLKF